ncbi:MAG: hypothetical protein MK172_10240 [Verrucomicrobiales bacterium]|nr:hypothetical protein [Verrucomicrobiales bacterium]
MTLTAKIAQAYADYQETYEGEISDISEYTDLGEGAAQILSGIKECLYLGLKELSEPDAEILLRHKDGLNFNGSLMKISNEAAKILSRYEGELGLNQVHVGEEGKQALKGRQNVQDESEYHSYLTVIDEKWIKAYDPESDDCEYTYLESPTAAKMLVDAAMQADSEEDYNPHAHLLGQIIYCSVEALRELANYPGGLDMSWRQRFDVSGARWTDEHFEALGHCAGPLSLVCGGVGEEPDEAITAKQLGMLRDQDLTLEYITALTDDCYDSIKGRSGSLSMYNFGNVSPRVAEALSTVKNLDLGEVSNCESLNRLLGPDSLIENLSLRTKYIDGEIATVLAAYGGNLDLRAVIYLTEDAAKCLGQKKGGLEMPGDEDTSILVEGNGTEALLQHPDSGNWPETEVYDEDGEWVETIPWAQSVNQVIEEGDVKISKEGEGDDENTYVEMPSRPMITDDALKKVIAAKSQDLCRIRFISDQQAAIISSLKAHWVDLGVCRLTDEQIDSLLKIRATISLRYLRDVSENGARKLIRSNKVVELGGKLGEAKEKHENDPDKENTDDEENTDGEEETDDTAGDVYFNLGRIRSRMYSGDTHMGGPEDLLDEIESDIKSGDFPHKDAMLESLLAEFVMACVENKDTSSIKEKIAEIFWNPEEN